MPLEQHPTDPDKLVFRAHQIPRMYSQDELDAAVAAEREACAKTLDDWKKHNWTFEDCAAAVRARSNT